MTSRTAIMSPIMLLVLSALLAHATATPTPTRALLQAPDPVRAPPRCERPNNSLGVTCEGVGREWSGDEIDCRWDGDYELECEYDTELLSRDRVDCSLDVPGVGTDRSFDCPIVNSRVQCDYGRLALPAEAERRVRLVLDTWCPRE